MSLTFVAVSLLFSVVYSIPCLNRVGNPVDWYFMILLPSDTSKFTYIYVDANSPTNFVNGDIDSSVRNPLANTVKQLGLYGASVDTRGVGWAIWNDQVYNSVSGKVVNHEKDHNGHYYAHSKGLFGFDNATGFWLTHSAPGFPYGHSITPSSWSFNSHQAYFAQHFFCSTFNTGEGVNKISQFLSSYHAYLYDTNTPSFSTPQSFQNLVNNQFTSGTTNMVYKTSGGTSFVGFGKNGQTESDLYEDYVAPGLNCGLNVESWCGGNFNDSPGCQPSNCAGSPIVNPSNPQNGQSTYAFDSVTIQSFDFGNGNSFDTPHNHCKFAVVTSNCGSPWVCVGDINRQVTQRQRGGGAICFKHSGFYGLISKGITGLNATCPNRR